MVSFIVILIFVLLFIYHRNCLEYEVVVRKFVSEASSRLGNLTKMFCPVLDHLVIKGMDLKYKRNPC